MPRLDRSLSSVVLSGAIAGIVGGILIDGYILVVAALGTHHPTPLELYQFDASAILGKIAYSDPKYAWLGLAVHFAVSLGWGIGYAYAAKQAPQIDAQPLVSGIAYGLVVYVVMQAVQLAANVLQPLTATTLVHGIIDHTLFFGLPVAYAVRAFRRA